MDSPSSPPPGHLRDTDATGRTGDPEEGSAVGSSVLFKHFDMTNAGLASTVWSADDAVSLPQLPVDNVETRPTEKQEEKKRVSAVKATFYH